MKKTFSIEMSKIEKYTYGKRLLEKHGWESGKGLGRNESGIAEALKPTLKFDKTGVGHNPGDEFSFHWWDHMFNRAASNIVVEQSEGGVKMSRKGDDPDLISTKKWKHKKGTNSSSVGNRPMKYGTFVKGSVLTPNGEQHDRPDDTSSEDSDDMMHRTEQDDALFKACEGRTAHKGARHGLTASGKLKRLEAQEHGAGFSDRPEDSEAKRKLSPCENAGSRDQTSSCDAKKRKTKKKKSKTRDGELKNSVPVSRERQGRPENVSNERCEDDEVSKQEDEITEPSFHASCTSEEKIMNCGESNKNCHKKKKRKNKKKHKKLHI